jgi:hypothetical protein
MYAAIGSWTMDEVQVFLGHPFFGAWPKRGPIPAVEFAYFTLLLEKQILP